MHWVNECSVNEILFLYFNSPFQKHNHMFAYCEYHFSILSILPIEMKLAIPF